MMSLALAVIVSLLVLLGLLECRGEEL